MGSSRPLARLFAEGGKRSPVVDGCPHEAARVHAVLGLVVKHDGEFKKPVIDGFEEDRWTSSDEPISKDLDEHPQCCRALVKPAIGGERRMVRTCYVISLPQHFLMFSDSDRNAADLYNSWLAGETIIQPKRGRTAHKSAGSGRTARKSRGSG